MGRRKTQNVPGPIEPRFWSKVDKQGPSDCWLWTGGCRNAQGYGVFCWGKRDHGGKTVMAHRASWELHNGPIPEGIYVCHTCDERYPYQDITYRRCVNPTHLYLGTHQDNMRDRDAHNRRRVNGESNPRFGDHRSYDELYGAERSGVIKHIQSDRSGFNSNRKHWQLVSPSGDEFLLFGGLQEFCMEHKLSIELLRANKGTTVYPSPKYSRNWELTRSTFGWTLYDLGKE